MAETNGANDPGTAEGIAKIPIPMGMAVRQQAMPDGSYAVCIIIDTPDMTGTWFMPGDVAMAIGKEMKRLGEACRAGLFVPPPRR